MSKVSVLIAVYNSERYLEQCLDSVCSQSLSDIQIICIDDCSTDSSPEIIDRYARTDNRVKVIHMPENRGQAIARNAGLEIADGEYVMMLDSDDWLEADSIEKAYLTITAENDIDCCLFDLKLFHEDDGTIDFYRNDTNKKVLTGKEAFELSLSWRLHGLYMVRISIHKSYPYDTSCRLYSDDNTTHLHYLHSRKVAMSEGVYFYRKHSDSMTNRVSVRRFDHMDANLSMKRILIAEIEKGNIDDSEQVLDMYETYRWLNVVDAYWLYYSNRNAFTEQEREDIGLRIKGILATIDRSRIPISLKIKLGYYPFRSYKVFSVVENMYFRLRRLIGRG